MNHLGDTNKMVSDTPISDSTPHNVADLGMQIRRIERQLNAANDRIKRLEQAGDAMDKTAEPFVLDTIDEDIPMSKVGEQYEIIYDSPPTAGDHVAMDRARKEWRKAKEAKP